MPTRSKKNQEIYERYLWPLLAGDISIAQVAKGHNLKRATIGMWLTGAREKLGGSGLAATIARKIIDGDLVPVGPIDQDIKHSILKEHLNSVELCLGEFNSSSLSVEPELKNIVRKLIFNVRGQAERGTFRYSGQDCTGRPLQLERDLKPKELLTLVETIDLCERVDTALTSRRSKREKLLSKREDEISRQEEDLERREKALGALFGQYKQRVVELKKLESKLSEESKFSSS